ncbi:MAG TPA: flagellar hook-basal body complex protein, partial [Tepidisphaeraceae bacterium]|nr:flagellar hook-basal body complex protein [Tepidisphaeraceae bacterium]
MGLSNALFAGLSGLNVSQAKLNVVGNNIANVNTVAFKSSRILVKPQFYVTDANGTQPSGDSGGTNPSQRGLGAVVASIDRNLGTGSIETTGRDTDMAIDGDGYFIVRSDTQKYTRDGSFHLNEQNQLVTNGGDFVQGYAVDQDFNIVPGQLSNITIPLKSLTTAQATTQTSLTGTLDANVAPATLASILTSQALVISTAEGGGVPSDTTPLTHLAAASAAGTAIFTVDPVTGTSVFHLSGTKGGDNPLEEATFTVTDTTTVGDLRAFLANSLAINTTVPDDGNPATPMAGVTFEADPAIPTAMRFNITGNLGSANRLSMSFVGPNNSRPLDLTEQTDFTNPPKDSIRTGTVIYDSLGTPLTVNVTAVLESKSTAGITWRFYVDSPDSTTGSQAIGTGTLEFDDRGNLVGSSGTQVSIPRDGMGAVTPLTFDIDVSGIKCLTGKEAGSSELSLRKDDGSAIGTLGSFSIGSDGTITGHFDNGTTRTLGQVAVAIFSNPQALVDRGGNMFAEGPGSGSAVITTPNSLGAGKIQSRSLEMSNVDLSEEFINLIIASTGF